MGASKDFKIGDLVVFNRARMTNRGVDSPVWNLDAVMVILWVPPASARSQIVAVLMDGKPTSVGLKHLKHINE